MAISKKKDSPYYYTRFSVAGIRVQESTRCTTKRDAQEYEEKRRKEIREHVLLGKKPGRSWSEAVLRWIEEGHDRKGLYDDISHFKWIHRHLGKYQLKEITKEVLFELAQAKRKEGRTAATVNRMLSLVRALLNKAAAHWEWIDKVPVFPKREAEKERIRWLTRAEADALLMELPPHLKAMAKFTLATGLRASNVFNLKWSSIDLARNHAVISSLEMKNKEALGVPLNSDAMQVLHGELGKHTKFVFVYKGKPVTQMSTKAWRKALKRAGIEDFRWHDLRHTWASWHVQSGTSLQELFILGGWKSFEMVLKYAHLSSTHVRDAAERISSGAELVKC